MNTDRETGMVRLPRIRAAVASMKPYIPGTSLESVQRELGGVPIKLNQNENPLGPSPFAVAAAIEAMAKAHTYPEGAAPALRERLATLWDLPTEWFLPGNGSDEIFRLLAETYVDAGDRVIVPAPSFAGYRLVAELMGAKVIQVPLRNDTMDLVAMASAAAEGETRMLFLCRPNSPTGAVFPATALRDIMPTIPPDTLVVLDEAYRDFDESEFDSRTLLLDFPNLIVTRTFSKIYGLAGLRLGYGIMRPELLAPLLRVRDPFSVNLVAVAAGVAALDDVEHVDRSRRLVHQGKRFLAEQFERLGIDYIPTQANFVLLDTIRPASEMYQALLHQGVLVRACASFGLPHSLRVTIGTAPENAAFTRALECVIRA